MYVLGKNAEVCIEDRLLVVLGIKVTFSILFS